MLKLDLEKAAAVLKSGGLIAYPTEAVYGFGCDIYNKEAVLKLYKLKQRSFDKGMIVVGASWTQLKQLTMELPGNKLEKILETWPGPNTWIFPSSSRCPEYLKGMFDSIALRVSDHPIVTALCEKFGPIVSTSANLANHRPLCTYQEVVDSFADQIDFIVPGDVGGLRKPTTIRDGLTGTVIR